MVVGQIVGLQIFHNLLIVIYGVFDTSVSRKPFLPTPPKTQFLNVFYSVQARKALSVITQKPLDALGFVLPRSGLFFGLSHAGVSNPLRTHGFCHA